MRVKDKVAVVTLFWLRVMYDTPCSAFSGFYEWCGLKVCSVSVTTIIQFVTLPNYLHAVDQTCKLFLPALLY